MYRIATSEMFKDTLMDILDRWTIDDLVDAHEVLDAMQAAR